MENEENAKNKFPLHTFQPSQVNVYHSPVYKLTYLLNNIIQQFSLLKHVFSHNTCTFFF